MLRAVREFFVKEGYLEVETPNATPYLLPEVHIEPIPCAQTFFLHPSPELYMKQLLGAGYENIFQICKCFRAHEKGLRHLPEFTMLEWYATLCNYELLMDECENLVMFIAQQLLCSSSLTYKGKKIDLCKPWYRITLEDAFLQFASVSLAQALADENFDTIYVMQVEPKLPCDKPVFIYDYPLEIGAFAKKKASNPLLAERFELYVGGLEIANGYSEIDDKDEQEESLKRASAQKQHLRKQSYHIPPTFVDATAMMPNSAGIAFGIDRLAMLFADTNNIDDVVAFAFDIS